MRQKKAPLRKGGWQPKGLTGGLFGISRKRIPADNPSVTAAPRHLPLHKGGVGLCVI